MTEPRTPGMVYLSDYQPPPFHVVTIDLDVDIQADFTQITTRLALLRNPAGKDAKAPLVLDGDGLELLAISLDGRPLDATAFQQDAKGLTLTALPDTCELQTTVRISPEKNTQLMGLYAAQNGYFTQCEAEGFRRITFYPDRPDVMSRFTTTIRASRVDCPVLLSNGNQVAAGITEDGRHWARWVDPFPKPAYLFALVAARLDQLEDRFTTLSGREIRLGIYVEPGRLDQCQFAMAALKSSMRWDEDTYGLEFDLDQYMIVAVSDFNMGAMENKGLNIFNTKYVLARPDLASDQDFMMLDRVIAHEYFHNWTGNRVTCRDWFQLSLKEGLTVFRDQQYGGDRYSHGVQRIQEVQALRNSQFPEDAGAMAHPVRPSAYLEISNFYTATIYNKGAEVVRMIHTLLGAQGFRRGMDLYFARHDGQAVCTEDFVRAMQDASDTDLTLMQRWYDQAGTPRVKVIADYDAGAQTYTLHFTQSCAPGGPSLPQHPFPIPIKLGLLSSSGKPLALESPALTHVGDDALYLLREATGRLRLTAVPTHPIPSLLRGFSAPVALDFDYSDDALACLMAHDVDPFNRWEAGQRLAMKNLLARIDAIRRDAPAVEAPAFLAACGRILASASGDPAFAAEALGLPAASFIAEQLDQIDPDAILAARVALRRAIALHLRTEFYTAYHTYTVPGPYEPTPVAAGRRALRNVCLSYLMELGEPAIEALCYRQFETADNMTDASAALMTLANVDCPQRRVALAAFYHRWQAEPLVLDKWFAVQATSRLPGTLKIVETLLTDPMFELTNPNRVRALIGSFCQGNQAGFHATDGSGYRFGATQICALDPLNPQIAARLARAFDRWRKFDPGRQIHARAALMEIQRLPGLSKDTTEVVTRALN